MNDGVKKGSEFEVESQTGRGCGTVEREEDCEAVGRAGGRESVSVSTHLRFYFNYLTTEPH